MQSAKETDNRIGWAYGGSVVHSRSRLGREPDNGEPQHVDRSQCQAIVPQFTQIHPAEAVRVFNLHLGQRRCNLLGQLVSVTKALYRKFPPEPRGEPCGEEEAGVPEFGESPVKFVI